MRRHLHVFEGVAARFNQVTTDGRYLTLPEHMRESRSITTRDLPLPLTHVQSANFDLSLGPWRPVGFVVAAHEGDMGRSLMISGILDLNEMDQQAREVLLAGGEIGAGVDLDQVEVDRQVSGVARFTDWRLRGVMTGSLYRSAWEPQTFIKLRTGPYADLSKIYFPTDQGDPK